MDDALLLNHQEGNPFNQVQVMDVAYTQIRDQYYLCTYEGVSVVVDMGNSFVNAIDMCDRSDVNWHEAPVDLSGEDVFIHPKRALLVAKWISCTVAIALSVIITDLLYRRIIASKDQTISELRTELDDKNVLIKVEHFILAANAETPVKVRMTHCLEHKLDRTMQGLTRDGFNDVILHLDATPIASIIAHDLREAIKKIGPERASILYNTITLTDMDADDLVKMCK